MLIAVFTHQTAKRLPQGQKKKKKLLAILKAAFSFSLYVYFQWENDLKISMHQVFPLSIILATNKENYESESHIKEPSRRRQTGCWMEASMLQSKDSQRCLQFLIQSLPVHLQTAPCWMSSILAIVSFKSWVRPSLQFACWNKVELKWYVMLDSFPALTLWGLQITYVK